MKTLDSASIYGPAHAAALIRGLRDGSVTLLPVVMVPQPKQGFGSWDKLLEWNGCVGNSHYIATLCPYRPGDVVEILMQFDDRRDLSVLRLTLSTIRFGRVSEVSEEDARRCGFRGRFLDISPTEALIQSPEDELAEVYSAQHGDKDWVWWIELTRKDHQ